MYQAKRQRYKPAVYKTFEHYLRYFEFLSAPPRYAFHNTLVQRKAVINSWYNLELEWHKPLRHHFHFDRKLIQSNFHLP